MNLIVKEILNFPNYTISSKGEVYSIDNNRYLAPVKSYYGYHQVTLCYQKKRSTRLIHRLVADAFIPNLQNKPQINHIDGNKFNNSVENLEWVTSKENIKHSIDTGLTKNKGVQNKRAICTEEQVRNFCELLEDFPKGNILKLGKSVGLNRSQAYSILYKDSWVHISSEYNIPNYSRNTAYYFSKEQIEDILTKELKHIEEVYKISKSLITKIRRDPHKYLINSGQDLYKTRYYCDKFLSF